MSSPTVFERSRSFAGPQAQPSLSRVTWDSASILPMQSALVDLAGRSEQPGAMDDLEYFLARPQIRKKAPCLVSLGRDAGMANTAPGSLDAAVLLYEHHVAGHGIRIFATDDTTGRRTLISAPRLRSEFALVACHKLLMRGAQIILISFRHDEERVDASLERLLEDHGYSCRWASREREIAGYLPLDTTVDATLARVGNRTRSHLRYYRRRAESQLGAVFVPEAKISREDFLALNRVSAYPVTDDIAGWRYDSLRTLKSPLLYGMRDRDGGWLSLIGGRHYECNMELHWQMNRDGMPSQSLGSAMRAFLIEHEIAQGTRRFYIEGGTTHSMSHAFVHEKATDLIVMRQSPLTRVLPSLVKRFLPPENMLLQVLEDTTLQWRMVKKN